MPSLDNIAWIGCAIVLLAQLCVSLRCFTALSGAHCAMNVIGWAAMAPQTYELNNMPALAMSTAFMLIIAVGYGRNHES